MFDTHLGDRLAQVAAERRQLHRDYVSETLQNQRPAESGALSNQLR